MAIKSPLNIIFWRETLKTILKCSCRCYAQGLLCVFSTRIKQCTFLGKTWKRWIVLWQYLFSTFFSRVGPLSRRKLNLPLSCVISLKGRWWANFFPKKNLWSWLLLRFRLFFQCYAIQSCIILNKSWTSRRRREELHFFTFDDDKKMMMIWRQHTHQRKKPSRCSRVPDFFSHKQCVKRRFSCRLSYIHTIMMMIMICLLVVCFTSHTNRHNITFFLPVVEWCHVCNHHCIIIILLLSILIFWYLVTRCNSGVKIVPPSSKFVFAVTRQRYIIYSPTNIIFPPGKRKRHPVWDPDLPFTYLPCKFNMQIKILYF